MVLGCRFDSGSVMIPMSEPVRCSSEASKHLLCASVSDILEVNRDYEHVFPFLGRLVHHLSAAMRCYAEKGIQMTEPSRWFDLLQCVGRGVQVRFSRCPRLTSKDK